MNRKYSLISLLVLLGCPSNDALTASNEPMIHRGIPSRLQQHEIQTSPSPPQQRKQQESVDGSLFFHARTSVPTGSAVMGRRNALWMGSSVLGLWGTTTTLSIGSTSSIAYATEGVGTIYKSGKAPIIPGTPPKDKNDLKGTKKDPDFLRSISGCKSQCQTAGDGSLVKSKEDCLSECQDICCKTYEQCTFDIVPRI